MNIQHATKAGAIINIQRAWRFAGAIRLLVPAFLALFLAVSAQAVDVTNAWANDADGDWSVGSNWKSGGAATGTTGVAYFTNAITANRTVNLDSSPWTINGLTFTNTGAFGWAITNGTLNLAGTTPGITVYTNSTVTIQSTISGSAGLQKNSPGQLILSGSNSFSGDVAITSGELKLGSANALNQTPGSESYVNLNNSSGVAPTLTLNGNSITVSSLRGPKGNAVIQNANTTPATLTVGNNKNLISSLWDGMIQDGVGGGALTVVKMGANLLNLGAGGNTFSGGLFIKAGTVYSGSAPLIAFGIGGITIGDSTVGQDATLLVRSAVTVTNAIAIAPGAGARTISVTNVAAVLSGAIVMNTNLTVWTPGGGASPSLVLSGGFTGTGSLTLNDNNTTLGGIILSNATVNMIGAITNSGTGSDGFADTTISADIGPNVTRVVQNSATSKLILSGAANTYTGPVTILAGTLTIGGAGKLGSGNYPGVISNGGTLVYNSSAIQALGGISGSGAVTVSAGMLGCTGTISGPVSVTAVGSLSPSLGTGGSNTLTLSSAASSALTLDSGSRLNFAISSTGTNDQIKITGGLTLNGPNYITLSFPGGTAPVGTYTLMTYNGTNGTGSLVLDATYPNATLSYDNTKVTLTVDGGGTSAGSTLTWKGNVDGNWGTALNWTNMAGLAVTYSDGKAVTFDQNASGFNVTGTVSTVSPDSVTISNIANAYTIRANIGGSGYLVKNGSGTATLTGTNSYTGFTTIGAGTLTIGGAGQLGNGNYAGAIRHSGSALNFASSAPNTLSGGITKGVGTAAPVTSSGTGQLTLSGVNSISTLTVSTGTTVIANMTALSGNIIVGNVVGSSTTMIISNGTVATSTRSYIGSTGAAAGANSNLVVVTGGNSIWNGGGVEINIGYGTTGNVVRVENGGILTNYVSRHAESANSVGNGLIITNGGLVFTSGGSIGAGSGANGNYTIVAGNGATWSPGSDFHIGNAAAVAGNWVKVDQGGIITNGYVSVGDSGSVSNYLIITNGGKFFCTGGECRIGRSAGSSYNWVTVGGASGATNALWSFSAQPLTLSANNTASTGNYMNVVAGGAVTGITTLTVGNVANANANGVRVTGGGLLEVTTGITVGNASSIGNYLTNSGGFLQFTTATPAITLNNAAGGNGIVITNGTLSYRNVALVNLTNNWAVTGTGIGTNNITWQGNNTLRLDGSTATNTLGRPYQFNTGFGPTNYVALELLNTSFIKGNEIVIGTNGTMTLVSGATAVLSGVTTNYGTLAGSGMVSGQVAMASGSVLSPAGTGMLSFSSNLTFTGTSTYNWNYTASTCSVVQVGGGLILAGPINLNITGSNALPANPVLFTWQGAAPSLPAWNITPSGIYKVTQSGNSVVLSESSGGLLLLIN